MFKKTSLALMVSVSFGASAGSVNFDGHFDNEDGTDNYSEVFAINYYNSELPNPTPITGGILALSTGDDGKQYLYISHPLGFKDLSYGGEDKYDVGWKDSKKGTQDNLDKAIGSEFIALQLTSEEGDVYGVSFNPQQFSKGNAIGEYDPSTTNSKTLKEAGKDTDIGDGVYTTDDGKINIRYLSTSDYNRVQAQGWGEDYEDHSPQTQDCDGIHSESRSDSSCYNIANIDENKINGNLIKWDFRWGLEIELDVKDSDALFFGDLANINLEAFGYQSDTHIISLDALHASEPKTPSDCHHDTCDADVVYPDDPKDVPEPSTFAIFSLALAGLWARRRRSPNT